MSEVDVRLLSRLGVPITGLPDAQVTLAHWVLSESGDASFDIHPRAPGANLIKQWDTEIQIWWDGVLRWWGIPTGFGGNSSKVTVKCESLLAWFKRRMIDRTSLLYGDASTTPPTLLDQFTIAWDLVQYAQDESFQANRNLNISAATFSPSGIGRSAIYKREEHKFIYDLLQEFRDFYQGFEFDIVITGDGHRFWTPYYPHKGTARPEFKMFYVDEDVRNISDFTWTSEGSDMVTQDYATGGSVNQQKIEQNYEDVEASSRHGVLQAVTSQGSELDTAWLLGKARGEVEKRKEPITTFTVTSATTNDLTMFGALDTGDWIPVQIDCGMIQENSWRRVRGITWNPNDSLAIEFGETVAA